MIKRTIAVAAGMAMLIGAYTLPKANTGGIPVHEQIRVSESQDNTDGERFIPIPVTDSQDSGADGLDTSRYGEFESPDNGGGDGAGGAGAAAGEPAEEKVPEQYLERIGELVTDYNLSEENDEEIPENDEVNFEIGTIREDSGPEYEYLGDWTISFYCNCYECCGGWSGGPTASGAMPSAWWTAATDGLPFGTILYVDGLGTFEVQDRGTDYGWLDVFVSSHDEALANGLQTRSVYIVR